jgi:hypothetical protein
MNLMAMNAQDDPFQHADEANEIARLRQQLAEAQRIVDRIEARMAEEQRRNREADAMKRLDADRRARERRERDG